MELKTLRTFLAVADVGTVSHAAGLLNSVQSNITSRIKMLEDDVGVVLFLRSRNGMTLTAAGELFLPYAQKVLEAEEDAAAALKNFSDTVKILRIGSMETTLAVRLPPHLAAFRKNNTDVKIHVTAGPTDDLVALILEKKIDIAFIGGPFPHPDIQGVSVFQEEMVLVTNTETDTPTDAQSKPVIVFKPGCSYRAFANNWMRKTGLSPNDMFELGTLDGILGCVASGIGVTFLPRSVVENNQHRDNVTIHLLDGKERFIDTHAIYNKRAPENGAVAAFIELTSNTSK